MKRFFIAAAAIGLLAGVGSQVAAQQQDMCMWNGAGDCWKLIAENGQTVAQRITACEKDAWHFKGGEEGTGTFCKDGIFVAGKTETPPSGGGSVTPLGCCDWNNIGKCYTIYAPDKPTDCAGEGGTLYSDGACPGTNGECPGDVVITPPTPSGGPCKIDGLFAFCGYAPYQDDVGGCYKISNQYAPDTGKTCEELITACKGNYGTVYTGSSSPAILNSEPYGKGENCATLGLTSTTSVKLAGSKAATPGLKVSYAKNRVTVNWTPAAKISSGTIQLLNAKGAALSTSYIKANSGKVTAKLATVGVPAGMYFVHISAVGVNGQKIVSQSAVSIVK